MVEDYVYIFVYMYMVQVQGTECTVYWELATGQRVKDLFVERNRLFCYQAQPHHQLLFLLPNPTRLANTIFVWF